MKHIPKMKVITVDEKGRQVGKAKWVSVPEPVHFPSNGFSYIESYVTRLLASSAPFTSLIIGTPDQQTAILLNKKDAIAAIHFSVDWRKEPERERAIRKFFADRKIPTSLDYLAGNGGVSDAMRCLGYKLQSYSGNIATLTQELLQQVYEIDPNSALNFTFEEHKNS
jgi:hypothetical protein